VGERKRNENPGFSTPALKTAKKFPKGFEQSML
jgi:hypothetical protein